MSLITRCPACATSFRVVPDQLRISQGWVRCGQCAEIFDAAQALRDAAGPAAVATTGAARPAAPPAPAPAGDGDGLADNQIEPTRAGDAGQSARPPSAAGGTATPTLVDMAPAWPPSAASEMPVTDSVASLDMQYADYQQTQVQADSAPAPLASSAPDLPLVPDAPDDCAAPDATQATDATARAEPPAGGPGAAAAAALAPQSTPADGLLPPADLGPGRLHVAPAEPTTRARSAAVSSLGGLPLLRREAAEAPEPAPPPPTVTARPPAPRPLDPAVAELSFMRDAPIAAVPVPPPPPRARRLRWAGAAGAVLLALVLLVQWLVHERDRLAAAAPALRPVVQALCVPLRCSVQAPRRIDAVVIDGSSFVALGEDGYRLGFNLRNRAAHAVALPAVMLSLTDVQEQPVVRRVLLPAELGTPPAELPAHGEWAASVDLRMADNAGRARVVGYRLDAFYP